MSEIGYGSRAVVWDKARNVGGAVHKIEAGKKTDMVFHTRLTKVLYLLGGKATIRVIKNGQIKGIPFEPGTSLSIPPGFMHQVEAETECIVIEFVNDPSSAYGSDEDNKDTHVVSKGTTPIVVNLPQEQTAPAIVMSEEDKVIAQATTKKKTSKKPARKKKTSKRTN